MQKKKKFYYSKKQRIWKIRKKIRIIYLIILSSISLFIIICYLIYLLLPYTNFTEKQRYVYIPSDKSKRLASLIYQTDTGHIFVSQWAFKQVLYFTRIERYLLPGKYEIKKNTPLFKFIATLKKGVQTPIHLVINKIRTKEEFATLIGQKLEIDSIDIIQKLRDTITCHEYGFNTNTILSMFIQNTYFIYWNSSTKNFLERMRIEYTRFWSSERRIEQLKKLNISTNEVITLASIIEEETNNDQEKPFIASVYLNRLSKRHKLEADPTIKYALQDFTIRRITFQLIQKSRSSPYNTYSHYGLPPGPICIPSISSIDAVLNAPKTSYFFFCAKPTTTNGKNEHSFAKTYKEHIKNAKKYHTYMREQRRLKRR